MLWSAASLATLGQLTGHQHQLGTFVAQSMHSKKRKRIKLQAHMKTGPARWVGLTGAATGEPMPQDVTKRQCLSVGTLPMMLLHLEYSMVIKLQTCIIVGS